MSDVTHAGTGRDYTRDSGPKDAAQQFFARYLDFTGRSNRGEFWFWVLDSLLIGIVLGILDRILTGNADWQPLSSLWGLVTLIPGIALGVRRLHDIGRTGWWLLIVFVPIVGWLVLLYFYVQRPEEGPNRFG